jgi:hypothetical protein
MRLRVAFVLMLALSWPVAPARAELTEAELRSELGRDLSRLGLNLPVWLGRHLPAVLAPAGSSGVSISKTSGELKLGIMARAALFNNLDDLASDLGVLEFPEALPALLPWAGVGGTLGLGLGDGVELDADVQFVPPLRLGDVDLGLQTAMWAASLSIRWRLNEPCGFRPAVVVGLGLGFMTGGFVITSSFLELYDEVAFDRAITGRVRLATFSQIRYAMTQLMPELKLSWCFGFFRPYLGLGFGLTHGQISNDVRFRAVATLDTIDGFAAYEDPVVEEARVARLVVDPARLTLRPLVGFDLDFGFLALTTQVDLVMTGTARLDGTLGEALGSFDLTAPDLLFQEGARRARAQATLQASLALRAIF